MVPLEALRAKFPWARFLAEGGFKQVYMVFNAEMKRSEAVSVMDMAAMEELGNVAVADSEVQLSLLPSMFSLSLAFARARTHTHTQVRLSFLLSRLVQRRHCPHFVQVYQFLRTSQPPPAEWGNADNKEPKGRLSTFLRTVAGGAGARRKAGRQVKVREGDYQYIRMELCDGGDVEEAMRAHPKPPVRVVVELIRQVRGRLSLRVCVCRLGAWLVAMRATSP